ncbi:nuclear transport factor 2 family protein [Mitsuaria sp. 7]|uniref:nuclear transport factor 2 family protein n=1 Tax=Mitsuaria sp. 7 TaxID=1658665 RepID=UPI0018D3EF95|nr:nuclear transport factor 2 family protein [Mitsuaria sp. 7]
MSTATMASATPEATSLAADLVQAQLDAYNAHDVEALIATYATDARQYEYPDRLLAKGVQALRERMATRFDTSRPHAQLLHRIALGNTVIDHERIVNQTPDGPVVRELIAIYEIDGTPSVGTGGATAVGRIVSARFVFGDERPA